MRRKPECFGRPRLAFVMGCAGPPEEPRGDDDRAPARETAAGSKWRPAREGSEPSQHAGQFLRSSPARSSRQTADVPTDPYESGARACETPRTAPPRTERAPI